MASSMFSIRCLDGALPAGCFWSLPLPPLSFCSLPSPCCLLSFVLAVFVLLVALVLLSFWSPLSPLSFYLPGLLASGSYRLSFLVFVFIFVFIFFIVFFRRWRRIVFQHFFRQGIIIAGFLVIRVVTERIFICLNCILIILFAS